MGRLTLEARIAASQVSSSWRSTALECPALWRTITTTITGANNALLREVLRRTRNVPITLQLKVNGRMPEIERTHKLLILHMAHIKSLNICFNTDFEDEYHDGSDDDGLGGRSFALKIPSSPVMTSLTLHSTDWHDHFELQFATAPDAFSSLELLHLGAVAEITLKEWPHFHSLRDLRFQIPGMCVSLSLLESVLAKCPALQQLVLTNLYTATTATRSVHLPRLRTLAISSAGVSSVTLNTVLRFFTSSMVPEISLYDYNRSSAFQHFVSVVGSDLSRVVKICITYLASSPDIQYRPVVLDDGPSLFNVRAVDDSGYARTVYCIPSPHQPILYFRATLQTLCIDTHTWWCLAGDIELLAVEELVVLGHPFSLGSPSLLLPALKRATIFIGTAQRSGGVLVTGLLPRAWRPQDVLAFFEERVMAYLRPLQTLTLKGGVLREGELDAEDDPLAHAYGCLADLAQHVNISLGTIR